MKRLLAATLFTVFATMPAFADPLNVFGTFRVESGSANVTIADCGNGSPCGEITWVNPASVPEGQSADTVKTAHGIQIMGLMMLEGFKAKKNDWRGGTIYDPEADKTYASRIKRKDDGSLQVKGCIGPICQTQVWHEVTSGTED